MRCPECGGRFEKRDLVEHAVKPVPGWPRNLVLVGAVICSGIVPDWTNDLGRRALVISLLGLSWVLTVVWVYLRRQAIAGPNPWLTIWLFVIAGASTGSKGIPPALETAAAIWVGVVGVGVAGWCTYRRPYRVCGTFLWLFGWLLFVWATLLLVMVGAAMYTNHQMPYDLFGFEVQADLTGHILATLLSVFLIALGIGSHKLEDILYQRSGRPPMKTAL